MLIHIDKRENKFNRKKMPGNIMYALLILLMKNNLIISTSPFRLEIMYYS